MTVNSNSEQNLYIKIGKDGKPETFPVIEMNLRDLYDDFDPANPPDGFVRFYLTPKPELKGEELYGHLEYAHSPELSEKLNQEVWHEVHHVKNITKEEKEQIIEEFKKLNPILEDWVYDNETASLIPPIPKPNDGKEYFWNTDQKMWMEPHDEKLPLDEMIDVAKELGYDLVGGVHDKPNLKVTQEIVDSIIEQVKRNHQ